ncbi:MAG: ATP-dependent Clp protease ATP-binding subunit ClpX [Eubacteriales bacterium]|nr:ATP-dependent Clp protease ATP-binding subunit ClpX [Eubacteriales bacterium]
MINFFTPTEIVQQLDEYVIGQDDAKRVLAVAVYNHYKRVQFAEAGRTDGVEVKKSNVMMLGPTGSGKTLQVTTLAKILNTNFVVADATAIVASDNVGEEINKILVKLLDKTNGDVHAAEMGIVFLDEIDKLVTGVNRMKGESIQQIMLKIVEGTIVDVPYQGKIVKMDTNNILFICGGAFVDLPGIVRSRIGERDTILLNDFQVLKQVVAEDFATFGMIPEFCGRFPVVVVLEALNRAALKEALVKPKNSLISQYKKMLDVEKVEIEFTEASLDKIAELAEKLQTGARGLRTICERFMTRIMFDIPSEKNLTKITITPEVVAGDAKPIFHYSVSKESGELTALAPLPLRGTSPYTDEGEVDSGKGY